MNVKRRAVLFDVDGVLVPTESLRAAAHAETVRAFGGMAPAGFYRRIGGAGMPHEEVRRAFIEAGGISADEGRYTETFRGIFRKSFRGISPVAGIPRLLRLLAKRGYLLAAVSSSDGREVDAMLSAAGIRRFFRVRVGGDEVARKKPAPEPYERALSLLGVGARTAAAVEDSASGVRSALAAGLPVLALRHEDNRGHDFSGAHILRSFRNAHAAACLIERLTM